MVQIEGSLRTKVVIKGKLNQIRIRPIRVSHFGDFWRAFREKRKEEKKKKEKRISGMD